jgi:hypothetical protein
MALTLGSFYSRLCGAFSGRTFINAALRYFIKHQYMLLSRQCDYVKIRFYYKPTLSKPNSVKSLVGDELPGIGRLSSERHLTRRVTANDCGQEFNTLFVKKYFHPRCLNYAPRIMDSNRFVGLRVTTTRL